MINEFLNNFNSHLPNWSSNDSDSIMDFLFQVLNLVPSEVLIALFLTLIVLILANIYKLIIKI